MRTHSQISGTLIAHNPFEYDYCVEAALESLRAFCNEVIVVDADSTDGFGEWIRDYSRDHPSVSVIHQPWEPSPHGRWLSNLTNAARMQAKYPIHFNLQADEVVHERSIPHIRAIVAERKMVMVRRWNFWTDNWHIRPEGTICSTFVCRLGPTESPSVGDAESLLTAGFLTSKCEEIEIFHYGFIRNPDAFVAKSIPMQEAYWNTHDPILDRMKKEGRAPLDNYPFADGKKPYPFPGKSHPKAAHQWLAEHNYSLERPS